MIERPADPRPPVGRGDDEFERRLFALIDKRVIHFPKGMIVPPESAVWHEGLWAALRTRPADWTRRFRRVLLSPALAYGLVLLLLIPAYRGLAPIRPEPKREPPAAAPSVVEREEPTPRALAAARTFDLGAGVTRGRSGPNRLVLAATDDLVVLTFLAPIRSRPGALYQAVLSDAAGQPVATERALRSSDALGNFVLVCRGERLGTGAYVLVVSPVTTQPEPGGEEYRYPFEVVRPTR